MGEKKLNKNKYVYVSDKYKTLDIKWDTGYQYFTFRVSVDDLLDIDAERFMKMNNDKV